MVRDTPILRYTTRIKYELGKIPYSATGCFVRDNQNNDYLVTNRHVLYHDHGISPEHLNVFVRSQEEPTETVRRSISLGENDQEPLTHPDYPDADVAAVPLGFDLGRFVNTPVQLDEFVPEETDAVLAGGDAIVIGHPNELRDAMTSYPIIRRAMVSTPYGYDFNDERYFLIDARMHNGMSGSPVFTSPAGQYLSTEGHLVVWRDNETNEVVPSFIGIHSGPIGRENELELHRVWYASLLQDIINQ